LDTHSKENDKYWGLKIISLENKSMKIRLSSSKRSTLRDCPYKLFLQQQGLKSTKKSSALIHGSAWHVIQETLYEHIKVKGWGDIEGAVLACGVAAKAFWVDEMTKSDIWMDYRDLTTEMEMLLLYMNHYASDEGFLEVVSTEEKFELVVPLSQLLIDEGLVEEITYSGVIDLRCKINGIPWLVDHKTTAGSITTEANKLNRSLQFIGYAWGEQEIYGEAEGFMANFAGCSCRKKKDGTWGKKNIQFSRSPQLYTDEDYEVFLQDVTFAVKEVAMYYDTGIWPKNYNSCYNYGRCGMYNQCQSGSLEPMEFYKVDLEEKGSDLLY